MVMTRLVLAAFFTFVAALQSMALAGSSQAGGPVLPAAEVEAFADRVSQDLAARGVHVAIVARTGRDPADLPDGIVYTHVGFWVYAQITQADGTVARGYRAYNLYQDADDDTRSSLIQDSPAEFFAGVHHLDAGIIIPDARLQEKLLKVIVSPVYAKVHNASYSVLANPNTSQFQNCTEHTLSILMAGLYDTGDIPQIKADIKAHFHAQTIEVSGMKRLLAPLASKALTTADHGDAIETATFGSIARFMRDYGLASEIYRITPERAAAL